MHRLAGAGFREAMGRAYQFRTTYCAPYIAQIVSIYGRCHDRVPPPRSQPRLHRALGRPDRLRAGQPRQHVRLPLLAYRLTGSALVAGATEAVHLLGLAGALLPAGCWPTARTGSRLMRWASGSGVLLYASLAAAGIADALTVPHLLVVALLTGAGAGVFAPAEISAVRTVVPSEDLPTALSQNQARQHVAGLVGGPLGGLLYGVARWLPFAVDAVTFAVSWVLLGRIRTDLSAPSPAARVAGDARRSWRDCATWPRGRSSGSSSYGRR